MVFYPNLLPRGAKEQYFNGPNLFTLIAQEKYR